MPSWLDFDRETISTAQDEVAVLNGYRNGKINCLIGTERLFHTSEPLSASFIGIPQADAGLHFPDFRAAERTYQRLCDAIQLVDRHQDSSELVLQTLLPDHHVMQAIARQDSRIFYEEELKIRHLLQYPPFSTLICIALVGKDPEYVRNMALRFRERLLGLWHSCVRQGQYSSESQEESENILGPLPSVRGRSQDTTRWVLILKGKHRGMMRDIVKRVREEHASALKHGKFRIEVKVNPDELL